MHFTYNEADPIGLVALVEASAIHSSIRIVSNDVTVAQSGKKKLPSQRAECDWTA